VAGALLLRFLGAAAVVFVAAVVVVLSAFWASWAWMALVDIAMAKG
jgi:hypothetical protein